MSKITHNFETNYPSILGRKFIDVELLAANVKHKLASKQGVDIYNIHDKIISNAEADDPIKNMTVADLNWYILTTKDGVTTVMAKEYMVPGSLKESSSADRVLRLTNLKTDEDFGLVKKTLAGLGFTFEEVGV